MAYGTALMTILVSFVRSVYRMITHFCREMSCEAGQCPEQHSERWRPSRQPRKVAFGRSEAGEESLLEGSFNQKTYHPRFIAGTLVTRLTLGPKLDHTIRFLYPEIAAFTRNRRPTQGGSQPIHCISLFYCRPDRYTPFPHASRTLQSADERFRIASGKLAGSSSN